MATRLPHDLWVRENQDDSFEMAYRVEQVLFSQRSAHQQVDIVQTADHGRMLVNDGIVMLCERDEFIYHEMIAHVPLFVHPAAEQILVVGGGDGGTAREILRHAGVKRLLMVEIDEVVVRACREHLPSVASAFDDPRLELRFEDALEYVARTGSRFDVVVVDSTDPVGPGAGLFGRQFYENTARLLNPGGIMITQAESPFYDLHDVQPALFANQRPFFKRLHMYLYTTLAYPGGLYSFGFASQGPHPCEDFKPQKVHASGVDFRYYTPDVHRAAFMLPAFVTESLGAVLDPLQW
jgi:spermidine synthase